MEKKTKHSIRRKTITVTGISLLIFVLLSAMIGYIFYRDAVALNPSADFAASCTQFFVIILCIELIVAIIVELIIVNIFNTNIILPIQNIRDAMQLSKEDKDETGLDMNEVARRLEKLDIHSKDEIEELYNTLVSSHREINNYISEIKGASWEEEHDSMTMLGNRNLFEKMINCKYQRMRSIYIARIDIVNLRMINDKIGIEAGDSIISKVAREMRRLNCDTVHTYRLEENNFLVAICDYTKSEAEDMIEKWIGRVGRLNRGSDDFECRLISGSAYGENIFEVDELLEEAEIKLSINKDEFKQNHLLKH